MGSLKLHLTTSGVQDPTRKGALLLHLAGAEVQDLFSTLDGTLEEKEVVVHYVHTLHHKRIFHMKTMCLDKLNKHKENLLITMSAD